MSDLKLGSLIEDDQHKDAIHIAVAPVVAAERLRPGMRVGLVKGQRDLVSASPAGAPFIGIVDPFLSQHVEKGQKCWLFMYPNTITSLRHEWAHPAFDAQDSHDLYAALSGSRQWLEKFAGDHELSYDGLISACKNYLGDEEITGLGVDISYESVPEMWEHFTTMTGIEVPEDKKTHTPFSCAC